MMLTPIVLSDSLTLGSVEGDFESFNPQRLLNPNRTAMLVDELKISNLTVQSQQLNPFSTVLFDAKLGSVPLTNGFVNLLAIAPTYLSYEINPNLPDHVMTWHFPRPLYVPPGVQFNVSLQRKYPFDGVSEVPSPWGLSLAGRSMPSDLPIPDKIYVPWGCSTAVYQKGLADPILTFQSQDNEIGNPFDVPMRMTRVYGYNSTIRSAVNRSPVLIQATLGSSKMFIKDQTPFLALFPPDRPVLRANALLQNKEFIRILLDLPFPVADDIGDDTLAFTTVGMVGYREVQTPLGVLP